MANVIALSVFEIISLIFVIITLFPQAFLNYRLKNTKNFSKTTIILILVGAQVTFIYLVWSHELVIISVSFGIFISVGLFIRCQIKYYEERNQLILSTDLTKKPSLLIKRLKFLRNYLILLLFSTMNGFGLYYIFELTKSKPWVPKLIGAIIPVVVDTVTYIPQIVLIIRMKSSTGYSLLSIISELIASMSGIISACLQEHFDVVPLVTFISIFLSQVIMIILKLFIYPKKKSTEDEFLPENIANTDFESKLFYLFCKNIFKFNIYLNIR